MTPIRLLFVALIAAEAPGKITPKTGMSKASFTSSHTTLSPYYKPKQSSSHFSLGENEPSPKYSHEFDLLVSDHKVLWQNHQYRPPLHGEVAALIRVQRSTLRHPNPKTNWSIVHLPSFQNKGPRKILKSPYLFYCDHLFCFYFFFVFKDAFC